MKYRSEGTATPQLYLCGLQYCRQKKMSLLVLFLTKCTLKIINVDRFTMQIGDKTLSRFAFNKIETC